MVCISWLSQEKAGPRLHLFFLPMPMNLAVLKSCLDRCRDFNKSKRAAVRMVDEEDLRVVSRADTPGVKFAKEVLCPVAMHEIYRIHQDRA